jgi:hypothetical protein
VPHTAPITFGPPILLGPQHPGSLSDGGTRERPVTDGLGGYTCGPTSGLRTRRQHALLAVGDAGTRVRRVAPAPSISP